MELLVILLIFSLGVILLLACFIGGIAFVFSMVKNLLVSLFGKKKE